MAASPYELRTQEPIATADADQVELSAMKGKWSVIDDAATDEIMSGFLDDEAEGEVIAFGEGGRHDWQARDLAQEELVGQAAVEINRRSKMLGKAYPFRIDGNKISYVGSKSGMYEFCLSTTMAPNITSKPHVAFPRAFERAVTGLVKEYFGGRSKAWHTGWPRTPKSRFKAIMQRLHNGSGEWHWAPEQGLGDDPGYKIIKDETVDFVIQVNRLDSRAGNLYVLGQCACGDDWNTKLDEPNLDQIAKWFNPAWIIPPLRAFTTPFVLGDETLRETSRRGKMIVFDRIRLAAIAENQVTEKRASLLKGRLDSISDLVARKS